MEGEDGEDNEDRSRSRWSGGRASGEAMARIEEKRHP